jgi:nucleotide-binding universal stress UspA family protein
VKATFAAWQAQAESYLTGVALQLEQAGVASSYRVVIGNPDSAICDLTKDDGVDLIVMGTHGRTGLRRWAYGSVANKVLRGASCPLLLVRTVEKK